MTKILDTVLLLALPASGKSEVRRYLEHAGAETRARDFRMGPSVQLDDYPYVHMMRRIDDELVKAGRDRVYFHAADRPFQDSNHWGTLIELLNEDYADLIEKKKALPASAAIWLLERMDAAAKKVGASTLLDRIDAQTREALAKVLEGEARQLLKEKEANYPDTLSGKTLVIEFARGGPDGTQPPLPAPLGYAYSLARLSPAILEKAAILYIWVTPEESRRKNQARTDPNDPGSILHHGVPIEVMLKDYGCDDMEWLARNSPKPGTVTVSSNGRTFHIPIARFDNRVDRTSFLRGDEKAWKAEEIRAVDEGLKRAIAGLPF